MAWRITTVSVALIVAVAAAAAAVFRVITAPQRVQEHLDTARDVCARSGGTWATEGREPVCRRP